MKIAVIGSGISGLVAANRLQSRHDVTLYEANAYLGGHTNTVDVELDGERQQVDTGFIVFNDWTYPNFIRLLEEFDVASKPTIMSFSVSDERTGLEYNGHTLNTLFAQRRNLIRPSFLRMVADILRFNREVLSVLEGDNEAKTVGEFVADRGYSKWFVDHYLLPMGAAIWSCPTGTFADFPIRFIAEFYRNHGLLNVVRRPTWRVIEGGSHTYVRAMMAGFRGQVRLQTPVRAIRRFEDCVEVDAAPKSGERYDHVIFACHADQALRILGNGATQPEREILAAFPYSQNIAVLHTDTSALPNSRLAWASWNYRLTGNPAAPASVTYNMNILQGLSSKRTFCVTLNDEARIAPEFVLARFHYEHPIYTTGRAAAQARHRELLSSNRTSFCGAYWRNGFHEDGVVSALAVVEAIAPEFSHSNLGAMANLCLDEPTYAPRRSGVVS